MAKDPAECRSCKAPIYWVTMASGRKMPIDRGGQKRVAEVDGTWRVLTAYKSHFESCPNAKEHRQPKPVKAKPRSTK